MNHRSAGGPGCRGAGSWQRTGSAGAGSPREHTFPGTWGGGITATCGLLIAPRPRRYVRGRDTPVPAPTPHSSHSPSSSSSPGRGRASPPLAPPRLTSDALRRLHLPPSLPRSLARSRSRLLHARLPQPAPTGGRGADPAPAARPPVSPRHLSGSRFIRFQSPPDFYGLVASFAAGCGFIFEKGGVSLQRHPNGLNRAELTHH